MTSRNIEKKENGSHALVQEDDIQISDSARKAINNVITREALINCDFSGNVLDEVDQAQVYIRDAIIVLAKEIWYYIDNLTNRNLKG